MRGKIKLSKTAADGAVALLFLVLGFQIAFFTGEVFKKRGKSVDIAPPEEKQERQIKADKSEKPDNNHSVSLPAIKKRIEAVNLLNYLYSIQILYLPMIFAGSDLP